MAEGSRKWKVVEMEMAFIAFTDIADDLLQN